MTKATVTKAGFSAVTTVYMRIKATDGTNTRYAEATASATSNKTSDDHHSLVGDHSDLGYNPGQERFWDDAFGRASKLTVYAFAIPGKTDASLLPTWAKTSWTVVNSERNPNWYTAGADDKTVTWTLATAQTQTSMGEQDLTYSNNIKVGGSGGRYTHEYSPAYSEEGDGKYPKTLQEATVMGDGQMMWWPKTIASKAEKDAHTFAATTGKFDQGHLIFNHALSWITINLKEGAGFNHESTDDFKWTNPTSQSITLKSFYTTGTFDISDATWSGQSANNITTLYEEDATLETATTGQTIRHLNAFTVPGNNLMSTTSNVIEFEIDNAKYYVTGKKIAEAIQAYATANSKSYTGFTTTAKGEHYVINLTVSKKGIDRITAGIVDWEPINSNDAEAKNTYPSFTFEDRGTRLVEADAPKFNLYRVARTSASYILDASDKNYDWENGYDPDDIASKAWQSTPSEWSATNWYWPDNKTYYHFRAAGDYRNTSGTPSITIKTDTTPDPNLDYFEIQADEITPKTGTTTYKDYIWGAPFEDIAAAPTGKLTYSVTSGFDNTGTSPVTHQISQAIGATDDVIQMLLFHMTSQITVNITTTTTADEVVLFSDNGTPGDTSDDKITHVEILNFLPEGTVLMGNGLVSSTGDRVSADYMTDGTYTAKAGETPAKVNGYTFGMVPQSLTYSGGTIGLRITTPDDNQYVVKDLSQCTATVTTTNITNPYTTEKSSGVYYIDRWYPSFHYTYNITIKKKGIDRITAAVVPWEEITGDNIDINLEN